MITVFLYKLMIYKSWNWYKYNHIPPTLHCHRRRPSQWWLFHALLFIMHRQIGLSLFYLWASCLHHMEAVELHSYERGREGFSINAICFTNTASDETCPWDFDPALVITILWSYSLLFSEWGNEHTFSGPLVPVNTPKINSFSYCTHTFYLGWFTSSSSH